MLRCNCLRLIQRISTVTFLYALAAATFGNDQLDYFEKQVRPILVQHCYECHSHQSEKIKASLLLDSRSGMLRGGDSGPAIVPNDPQASLLVSSIHYDAYDMPPKGKLSDAEIKTIETWVEQGAWWPDEPEPTADASKPTFDLHQRKATHWAWQPITAPRLPTVDDASWCKSDLDAFVLAKLEATGLRPSPPIDRRGLIRRLSFDLIGLPPSLDQVARYLDDTSPDATAKIVDELLESPHFGERWGRHWLDLVRYAESRGHEFDSDASNAYQYRDYVIRALNADISFDQFIREHIAGDLLEKPRLNPHDGSNESILGTGFWFLGEWVHSPVDIRKDETDRFDNMIDVMTKTFLGVTVGCARCHDHKFDAISTRDYYALAGFLQSSDFRQARFETMERERQIAAKLDKLDRAYRERIRTKVIQVLDHLVDQTKIDAKKIETQKVPFDRDPIPASHRRTLVDYESIDQRDFLQDGVIFGAGPVRIGDLVFEEQDDQIRLAIAPFTSARNDLFWHAIVNQSERLTQSNSGLDFMLRSGRTLRSPTFELKTGEVFIQARGSGLIVACVDSHRQVGGPLHRETVLKIKPVETNKSASQPVRWHRMKLERYAGHRGHLEWTPAEGTSFEILQAVETLPESERRSPPEEFQEDSLSALPTPREAFDAWRSGKLDDTPWSRDAIEVLTVAIEPWLRSASSNESDTLELDRIVAEWLDQRASLEQSWPRESKLAMAMLDGTGEDDRVLIRGSSDNPGPVVPRRFLEAIDGDAPLEHASRSGRLELADRINDANNPLTTRNIVNRVWHHLLGRGIVPTTDDFGVLGQPPTHPELLDFLATQFRNQRQSIKGLIRSIVLSQTYQMSSTASAAGLEKDPKNLLWYHVPPKRLEGEAIRDALLALSGNLHDELYGPSIPIHLTDFMDGRGRPKKSGPSDGANRRSIYVAVRRNFLSPFMLAFDTPSPFSTMGRRNVSNVPAQALILMNDPFVAKQAQSFAARAFEETSSQPQDRLSWLYETAFARPPQAPELAMMIRYIQQQAEQRGVGLDDPGLWTDVAHALINTKEFIFLR